MIGLGGVKEVTGGADNGIFLPRGCAERKVPGGHGPEAFRAGGDEERVKVLLRFVTEGTEGGVVARSSSSEGDGLSCVDSEAGCFLVTEEALGGVVGIGRRRRSRRKGHEKGKNDHRAAFSDCRLHLAPPMVQCGQAPWGARHH